MQAADRRLSISDAQADFLRPAILDDVSESSPHTVQLLSKVSGIMMMVPKVALEGVVLWCSWADKE